MKSLLLLSILLLVACKHPTYIPPASGDVSVIEFHHSGSSEDFNTLQTYQNPDDCSGVQKIEWAFDDRIMSQAKSVRVEVQSGVSRSFTILATAALGESVYENFLECKFAFNLTPEYKFYTVKPKISDGKCYLDVQFQDGEDFKAADIDVRKYVEHGYRDESFSYCE